MSMVGSLMIALVSMLGPPTLPPAPGRGVPAEPEQERPHGASPAPKAAADVATPEPAPVVQRPRQQQRVPEPEPAARPEPPVTTTPASASPKPAPARPSTQALSIAPRDGGSRTSPSKRSSSSRAASGDDAVLVASAEEPRRTRKRRERPKRSSAFALGYRQFWISDALGRSQSWHMGTMEITPARRYVRFNLLTEVGVEGSEAAQGGGRADMMAMQKLGLGLQYPHWVTPFMEFQGGVGAARVELFNRNDLLLVWSLGLDVGAQFALTRWLFVHTALGWIRPVFRRPERSIAYNSFAFKVGFGF
jgi:hypothetical protein